MRDCFGVKNHSRPSRDDAPFSEPPIPFTASPEVKSAVDGNTAFALDLYQKLKDQPGNLFFSPYSISTSLAMTYAGARGQTESEMAKALHFNPAQTNLPAAFGALGANEKNPALESHHANDGQLALVPAGLSVHRILFEFDPQVLRRGSAPGGFQTRLSSRQQRD